MKEEKKTEQYKIQIKERNSKIDALMMMAAISFTILQIHTNSNGVMGNSIAGNPYISSILIIIDGKKKLLQQQQ